MFIILLQKLEIFQVEFCYLESCSVTGGHCLVFSSLSIHFLIYPSIIISFYPSYIFLSILISFYPSLYLFIHHYIFLSILISFYSSLYLSIHHISFYPSYIFLSILISFYPIRTYIHLFYLLLSQMYFFFNLESSFYLTNPIYSADKNLNHKERISPFMFFMKQIC